MALEAARASVREDLARRQALGDELAAHEAVTAEPVPDAVEPGRVVAAGPAPAAAVGGLDRARAALTGARLGFGAPVEAHGRTVVGVSRVRGGDAQPLGVLELGPDGVRFTRLPAPAALQAARAGAAAAVVLTGAATALRLLRRR